MIIRIIVLLTSIQSNDKWKLIVSNFRQLKPRRVKLHARAYFLRDLMRICKFNTFRNATNPRQHQ